MTGSAYLHWAKSWPKVTFDLASSEVPHFRLDRLNIDLGALELDGASHPRYPPLRAAIAAHAGVDPQRVVMANGASMANYLVMASLIAPGDEVLIERPAYEPLVSAAKLLGARVRRFDRSAKAGFAVDPDEVRASLTAATRLVVLTNPHNPSSAFTDASTLRELAAMSVRFLVDEIYLDAVPGAVSAAAIDERFVVTSSLTKYYGLSGLRCGWIIADPPLAERMWRINDLMGSSQPHADERLSCIALAQLGVIAAGTRERLAKNHALAADFFTRQKNVAAASIDHGLTIFPEVFGVDPERLQTHLVEEYDTSLVPGRWFDAPNHVRIGLGGPSELVAEGLRRVSLALVDLAAGE